MTVTQQDYIKSDSKVKAAQSRLATAKDKLSKVGKDAPSWKTYNAEANNAEQDLKAAKKAAEEYFNSNTEKIQAEDRKKNAAKEEKAAAAVQSIEKSGRLTPEQIAANKKFAQKEQEKKTVAEKAQTEPTQETVDLVTQTNNALAELAKQENATNYLFNTLNDDARKALSQKLKDAGYQVPVSKKYSTALADAYISALTDAQSQNTYNSKIEGKIPDTLDSFLADKISTAAAGGTGAPKVMALISDAFTAASTINSVFNKELGRVATQDELSYLTKALNDYEKTNPYITGKTQRVGGVDQAEYIRQIISGDTKIKGKKESELIGNLNKEYTTKKTDKTTVALDDIKKTAQANGLPLNDSMIQKYADRLKAGETADIIKKDIRSIVAATMPDSVKKLLDAGSDLADVYSPYKTAMSSVLEIPYDKIDLNDPSLTGAITAAGNMPLYEFKNALRKDPRWQYTDNARQTVSTGLTQVLKDFGFMG